MIEFVENVHHQSGEGQRGGLSEWMNVMDVCSCRLKEGCKSIIWNEKTNRLFRCCTFYNNIFRHLDDALRSTTQHGCRQEIYMKATQINMEESERETFTMGVLPNRRRTPQNEELEPKRGSFFFLSYGHGLGMKSLTLTRIPYFANYATENRLKHHSPLLPFYILYIIFYTLLLA